MILKNTKQNRRLAVRVLRNGGIGVMPSDTLYGIMGSALCPEAVEKIYELRRRDKRKPFLVLISSVGDLKIFGVKFADLRKKFCRIIWPGATTVVFPCRFKRLEYLHRGTGTVAFRVPKPLWLRRFLGASGPLVAPSANYEGSPPSLTISGARKYFGNKISFYLDGGKRVGQPSTVARVSKMGVEIIRQGAGKIPKQFLTL
jgi:L-threonylcarbamoyladenylate synthase